MHQNISHPKIFSPLFALSLASTCAHLSTHQDRYVTIKKIFLFTAYISWWAFYRVFPPLIYFYIFIVRIKLSGANRSDFISFQRYIGRHNDSIKRERVGDCRYNLSNKSRPPSRNPIRVWSPISIILIYRSRNVSAAVCHIIAMHPHIISLCPETQNWRAVRH